MNDRTMIKVRCSKNLLDIWTISRNQKSPRSFAILRSELQQLERRPENKLIAYDCGSYATLRLVKGPEGMRVLEIHFTWLLEDGTDQVHGWKEDVRLAYRPFHAFAEIGEDMDGAEWRQLSIPAFLIDVSKQSGELSGELPVHIREFAPEQFLQIFLCDLRHMDHHKPGGKSFI